MKIAITGYGNLGKGVEKAVMASPDMELTAIFTRRQPETVKPVSGVQVLSLSDAEKMKDICDVMIICGGSATDLPEMTPMLAKAFNVVDSFDNHHNIPEHFDTVDKSAKSNGHVALISTGWDPGLFSINRLYATSVLPSGENYTFWGRGVSQGHSDAVRRIPGVVDARQYTVPVESAIERVRAGEAPSLSVREKHKRECYIVAEENADLNAIEVAVKTMPDYFADYDTTVTFITADEMKANHLGLPHGGSVIRTGTLGSNKAKIEFSLKLDSNPDFTGSVLTAYARAVYRLSLKSETGCFTVFDIAPALLSPFDNTYLRKNML